MVRPINRRKSAIPKISKPTGKLAPEKSRAKKSSPLDLILNHTAAGHDPQIESKYLSLAGKAPHDTFISSNRVQMAGIVPPLTDALLNYITENGLEVAVQTTRLGVRPGSAATISATNARKGIQPYRSANLSAVGGLCIAPVPFGADPHGFGLGLTLEVIVFGTNLEARLNRSTRGARNIKKVQPVRTELRFLNPTNREELEAAVKRLLTFPMVDHPDRESAAYEAARPDWKRKKNRGLRALLTFIARSRLPAKLQLIGIGAGKPLLTGVLARAEHNIRDGSRTSGVALHRDAVEHFWWSELRRLGLDDVSVPLILTN